MHVLKRIHRWLRPGAVLLDLHPEPEQPVIDVIVGGRQIHLGRIDTTSLVGNIHRARDTLTSIVREGWYSAERSMVFEFVSHFASVEDWLRHREERRSTSIVDPAIVARGRELLATATSGELRVSERVLATRFQRLERPANLNSTFDGRDG